MAPTRGQSHVMYIQVCIRGRKRDDDAFSSLGIDDGYIVVKSVILPQGHISQMKEHSRILVTTRGVCRKICSYPKLLLHFGASRQPGDDLLKKNWESSQRFSCITSGQLLRIFLGEVFETLRVTFSSAHFGYLLELDNIQKYKHSTK